MLFRDAVRSGMLSASHPRHGGIQRRRDMQAIETSSEGMREFPTGLFGEKAREFDNVISQHLSMFYNRAFRYLGNAPDAEDAVQDALLSAYRHLAQFRGQARLSTWLTTIVINSAKMQLRGRRATLVSLDQKYGEESLALSERLPDSRPDPEEVCSRSEAHSRLLKLSEQLSPTLRTAFQLRDLDGLTTAETARLLGVPEGTVKAQLARARLKLFRIVHGKPRRQRRQSCSSDVLSLESRRIEQHH
jgi:RNA polymerase sigma-70 factor (ECF subfamily)